MALQLTGESERAPKLYREFYGIPTVQMPLLVTGKDEKGNIVDVPRVPISFAQIIERRMNAPDDFILLWQNNYFFTGDGSVAGTNGEHLIVLDAQPLRELTSESELYQSTLVIPDDTWNELKKQKENVLYLTADEVQEANGKGYVKKNGIWTPANKTVGKIWDMLSRGKNLSDYVQLVAEKNYFPKDKIMDVFLNTTTKESKLTIRIWIIDTVRGYSIVYTGGNLLSSNGRLIGAVPTMRERTLESTVKLSLQQKTNFEFNC